MTIQSLDGSGMAIQSLWSRLGDLRRIRTLIHAEATSPMVGEVAVA
jgi:hypothetical protein